MVKCEIALGIRLAVGRLTLNQKAQVRSLDPRPSKPPPLGVLSFNRPHMPISSLLRPDSGAIVVQLGALLE